MSGRQIIYRPPKPVGRPFQGDPGDKPAFPREGSAGDPPSVRPAAAELPGQPVAGGPYVLPAGGATAGEIPPSPPSVGSSPHVRPPSHGDAPIFTKPDGRPVTGPHVAPPTEAARKARTALTVGIVSLLVLHIPLGPIAIVLGAKAVRGGELKTGRWAIAAGVGGTLIGILGLVLWATGVLPTLDELMQGQSK